MSWETFTRADFLGCERGESERVGQTTVPPRDPMINPDGML